MVEVDFSELTRDEIEDLLENHPDTEEIELGGQTFKLWFGGASFGFAEKEGIDLGEILDIDPSDAGAELGKQSMEQFFAEVQRLLFVGLKPLQQDITLTKIAFLLSAQERMRVAPKLQNILYGVGLQDAKSTIQKELDAETSGKKKDSN